MLYVTDWFRRLTAHASQSPLLQEALDKLCKYSHPWLQHAELKAWGKSKFGAEWEFHPMVDHTSDVLEQVRSDQPVLAHQLQLLWAGDKTAGTTYSSYRNRARELARICGETMDHTPGSLDMQIVERADINDGFQIIQMMKEETCLLNKSTNSS